jgi:GT2 family glycosyltransferase
MKNAKGAEVPLYIITVVFNLRIREIRSLRAFRSLQERHPLVCLVIADNSTEGDILRENRREAGLFGEERARQDGGFLYIACGGNKGLSRAYNLALKKILSAQDAAVCGRPDRVGDCRRPGAWVMLADDDTFFSMEYLERACRQVHVEEALRLETDLGSARRERLRVLCGVVLTGDTGNRFLSPRSEHAKELAFFGMLRPPKPGIYQDLYPINSGLFLEGSAIREAGGFDERLFLDQVDYLMMDRLRAHGIRRIGIVPGLIRQSFSGDLRKAFAKDGQKEPTGKGNRDRIFRKDFQTYCELTGKPWYYRSFILGRRRLMLTAKHLLG